MGWGSKYFDTASGSSVLTGDAAVGDVLDGKFFYADDAETKLEGTLALTGDAAVGDVVAGKTFYNTDAKTKLTGTALAETLLYTRVTRTNNQDVGTSAYTSITWENEINDDLGAWSGGAPTRLTVPADISTVKITGYVCFVSNNSDYRYARIYKNGDTAVVTTPELWARNENGLTITTGWLDVDEGDYFELQANSGTSGMDVLGDGTYPGPVFAVMEGI